jgi:hypothetical protein
MEPSQGTLALVEYSKRRCSGLGFQWLWVDQVQHWHDTAHHLVALTLPEIPVLPKLKSLRKRGIAILDNLLEVLFAFNFNYAE